MTGPPSGPRIDVEPLDADTMSPSLADPVPNRDTPAVPGAGGAVVHQDATPHPNDRAGHPGTGRRVLAAASAGGHFKQLVALVDRIPDVDEVTWLTHRRGMSEDLLDATGHGDDRVVLADYAAPRDLPNLARNARTARRVLRTREFDLAISTGAGIAVAVLPMARAHGVPAVFVESATRVDGPSLSGRILRWAPGVELCTQHPGYPDPWRQVGSVHDRFVPGPPRPPRLERVVVTTGTIRPYGFRRLVERLVTVLPAGTDVLWQTGATDLAGLDVDGRERVPAPELEEAMRAADVVVAHAGTGTALTAFELGIAPVLVPRRHDHGEHVDDHQVPTARTLADRGLATYLEADQVTHDQLLAASTRTVGIQASPPPLDL